MCTEKLREQRSVCREIRSYIYTNRHRDDQPQRYETGLIALPEPTSSTLEIVKCARATLRRIYQRGYGYKKAEIILSEISPASETQASLFASADAEKHTRLMKVLDKVNTEYGKGKIVIATQGTEPFQMNRTHLSQHYTTSWNELLVVKTQ